MKSVISARKPHRLCSSIASARVCETSFDKKLTSQRQSSCLPRSRGEPLSTRVLMQSARCGAVWCGYDSLRPCSQSKELLRFQGCIRRPDYTAKGTYVPARRVLPSRHPALRADRRRTPNRKCARTHPATSSRAAHTSCFSNRPARALSRLGRLCLSFPGGGLSPHAARSDGVRLARNYHRAYFWQRRGHRWN